LSRIAFEANVPIEVKAVVAVELATGTQVMSGPLVGSVQRLRSMEGWSTPELRTLLEIYRKGLNPTAPIYTSPLFYKIIEGISTYHKSRSRAAARAGEPLPDDPLSLRMPTEFEVSGRIPGRLGSSSGISGKRTVIYVIALRTRSEMLWPTSLRAETSAIQTLQRTYTLAGERCLSCRHVSRELLGKEVEREVPDAGTGVAVKPPSKPSGS